MTAPLTAIGGAAVKFATESQDAFQQFAASTGVATEAMGKYEDMINNVYKENFGENINEVAESMEKVQKNMSYLDDSALQSVTKYAIALSDTFNYDVAESTRTADTLIQNFGISARDAFNLISQGAQSGLDYSGELMDTINEYSPQFQKMGLGAEEMFAIFSSGVENGAFNLDKIGDAIKEFSIRAIDGSDTTAAGFQAIGLDATEMARKIAAGGTNAKDAFNQVIKGLADMEDPVAQNIAGVNLFGTMWEDLTPKVITSLSTTNATIDMTKESMEALVNTKYDTLSSALGGLWRTIQADVLQPIGNELIPYVETSIDKIEIFVDWWNKLDGATQKSIIKFGAIAAASGPALLAFGKLSTGIGNTITNIGKLSGAFMKFSPDKLVKGIMLAENGTLKAGSAFKLLSGGLKAALGPIGLIAVGAMLIYRNWDTISPLLGRVGGKVQELWQTAQPLITDFGSAFSYISSVVIPILDSAFQITVSGICGGLENMMDSAVQIVDGITTSFNGILEFVEGVFTGNWEMAWNGLANIVKGAFEVLVGFVKTPINAIIGIVNGAIDGINNIKFTVPEWVPGIGGEGWKGLDIPHIPTLSKGTNNWKGGIVQINEKGGEIVDLPKGTRVYPHDESVRMAREEAKKQIYIKIAKLAENIIVREEADIQKISKSVADEIAKKIMEAQANMA